MHHKPAIQLFRFPDGSPVDTQLTRFGLAQVAAITWPGDQLAYALAVAAFLFQTGQFGLQFLYHLIPMLALAPLLIRVMANHQTT